MKLLKQLNPLTEQEGSCVKTERCGVGGGSLQKYNVWFRLNCLSISWVGIRVSAESVDLVGVEMTSVDEKLGYGLSEWPWGTWLTPVPQFSKWLPTTLTGQSWINCIINVRALKRHEKIQKEKDRSLSPLAVSTAQKVHLVTSGWSVALATLIKNDFLFYEH